MLRTFSAILLNLQVWNQDAAYAEYYRRDWDTRLVMADIDKGNEKFLQTQTCVSL